MAVYIEKTSIVTHGNEAPAPYARDLRRADPFIRFGVSAVHNILEADNNKPEISTLDCGLFLGSAFGPMETNFDVLDQVVNKEQTSPTLFSHSVYNAAAGYLARIFQLQGCALSITDFGFPFFQALQQAITSLQSGHISSCLVLQIETFSNLLEDARKSFCQSDANNWHTGACAWLLTNSALSDNSPKIEKLSITTSPAVAEDYLRSKEELEINKTRIPLTSPLDAAAEITKSLNGNTRANTFKIEAPYGDVLLTLS